MRKRRTATSSVPPAVMVEEVVVVVGASFAGLSVARGLQHLAPGRFRVVLLEAEGAGRFVERENGEVNLHGLDRGLLHGMGLDALHGRLARHPARPAYVRRGELLRGLADSLEPGTLRHGARVQAVEGGDGSSTAATSSSSSSNNSSGGGRGAFTVLVASKRRSRTRRRSRSRSRSRIRGRHRITSKAAQSDEDEDYDGDDYDGDAVYYDSEEDEDSVVEERRVRCDHIVLAYGLSGLTEELVPRPLADAVCLAGDARVQFGYEGFFGWKRFNYGATSSMADGLRVARLLVGGGSGGGGGGGSGDDPDAGNDNGGGADGMANPAQVASWGSFSARRWQDTRRWRRMVIPRVFLLLLVALIARVVLFV